MSADAATANRPAPTRPQGVGGAVCGAAHNAPEGAADSATDSAIDDALQYAHFTRWLPTGAGPGAAESSLLIGGMHCGACATTVAQALQRIDGVIEARVSAAGRVATVRWNAGRTRPSLLIRAVERAGYTAVPDTSADARALRRHESRDALWRLFVATFCAMQVMMLAAPAYVSRGTELASDLKRLLDWGGWLLAMPVMLFSGAPFFRGAWRALQTRRIGMDVPVALGLLVAFVASSGAAFDPGGPFGRDVYFDSLTMFVSFLLAGRYLEMQARHRAEVALEESIGSMPEAAWLEAADGSVASVSVLRLKPGDRVRVPVGQAFCADGVVSFGDTRADESLLSGEARPVAKRTGDPVLAGSMNLGSPVTMRVDSVGADTRYEAIVALMRNARSQRPTAMRSADRWAAPFLWAVLLLAGVAGAAWWAVDPARAVWVVVSVLIVTCPCALSLAAPSAFLAGATAMARHGVLLRRIDAIEGLATMRTLFVDKTGTLTDTRGQQVHMTQPGASPQFADAEVRMRAASLAAWSTHPLAQAIAGLGGGAVFTDLLDTAGAGVQGRAEDGSVWRLGRRNAAGAPTHDDDPAPRESAVETWLSRNGEAVARFQIDEAVRAGVPEALRALQRDGVKVVLLSGDDAVRVAQLAHRLGLDEAHGGLAPQGKLAVVRAAQARGERVGMIGDGINDAPVIAQADVSLAMGAGAQIARAQADGVLASNALADVVQARALARRTLRVVRQNIAWAAAYNAACVPMALLGWLPPWAAGLGMATSSLVVVLNSLRLAR